MLWIKRGDNQMMTLMLLNLDANKMNLSNVPHVFSRKNAE